MRRSLLGLALFAFACCGVSLADTLDSTSVLEVDFTAAAGSWNTLSFGFGGNALVSGSGMLTFSLYDGNTLLGTDTTALPFSGFRGQSVWSSVFVDSTTAYPQENPPMIDFSTINSGSINGRLDISLSSGSISNLNLTSFSNNNFNEMNIISWNLTNGGGAGTFDHITSAQILTSSVPEPASMLPLAAGLLCLVWLGRKRRFLTVRL